jgi:hypothetical protein
VLFRGTRQPDRRRGNARHVSVSASGEILHQRQFMVQMTLGQDGVETALETDITLGLHCRRAR